jgi:hypothetical protein
MGVGEFTDERIIANIREDAFHSVVLATSLERDHPLRKELQTHCEAILKAIDGD